MTDGRHTNTRERILDAALDLMSERGYGAVSVRDLADAVGIKAHRSTSTSRASARRSTRS